MPTERTSVTTRTTDDAYRTQVRAGAHTFVMDLDASKGGNDAGPNPHELLAASLGACTAMTMKMYASRKGWHIDSIETETTHEATRTDESVGHRFVVHLRIVGAIDDAQRARLIEIAHRCPVHRALIEPKSVEIRA